MGKVLVPEGPAHFSHLGHPTRYVSSINREIQSWFERQQNNEWDQLAEKLQFNRSHAEDPMVDTIRFKLS